MKELPPKKDPEEQEWRCEKTVIGHRFSRGNVADARGDRDFLCPTTERVQLMIRIMDDKCFTPQGQSELTAKKMSEALFVVSVDVHSVSKA